MLPNNSYPWYFRTLVIIIAGNVVQYSVYFGQGKHFSLELFALDFPGNFFSWVWTVGFFIWAILWLKLPLKSTNRSPSYWSNGFVYYIATILIVYLWQIFNPSAAENIYKNFPQILASYNILTDLITIWLFVKRQKGSKKSWLNKILNGTDASPNFFGVDLKQLISSRITMMGNQIFIICFYLVGIEKNGFNVPCLVNFLIQSVYLAKFFWLETRNYSKEASDCDSVGFYYCYGYLVVMPAVFTFPTAYSIVKAPTLSQLSSILIGILGLICIFVLNLAQKFRFKSEKPMDSTEKMNSSDFSSSGLRGLARNIDFTLEFGVYLAFYCSLGIHDRLWNLVNLFFVGLIFIGRANRREKIFKEKYGNYWEIYCKKVPYKFIPQIF